MPFPLSVLLPVPYFFAVYLCFFAILGIILVWFKGSTVKKKVHGFFSIFSIILVLGIAALYTSCPEPVGSINRTNQTPVASDYTFGNMSQTAGSVTAVTITARSGRSPGMIGNIRYSGSATIPQTAGTYAVTFDVAAASGWNAATGLSAGNLTVNAANGGNQTPVAADYDIGKLSQTAGSVVAVTITAKSGKSPGAVGNIRYAGNTTIPQTAGTFAVTFDVAAATGWNAATGLSAGNLTVTAAGSGDNQTPVASDYTIVNLNQTAGRVTAVRITPNSGKSPGAVSNIKYNNSTTLPTTAGTYVVTFDVAAATGWNAATGLSAGNLTVTAAVSGDLQTPVAGDYNFSNMNQTAGNVKSVIITARSGKSPGSISNIRYEGSTTIPQKVGTYKVIFNVAAALALGWTSAQDLPAGFLIVINQTPVAGDYDFGNLAQTVGSVKAVTITPKLNKSSPGVPENIKYKNNATVPSEAGTYPVTFDVPAAEGWNAAVGLSAGSLVITYPFTTTETSTAVTIIGYTGTGTNQSVTIPVQINDKNVTAIGNLAFNNKNLISVSFDTKDNKSNVIFINDGAFANNQLSNITIPESVASIGSEAFYNNQLTSVTIPSQVTSISPYAFSGNELTEVKYAANNNVTDIGQHAFSNNALTSVTIPDNVTVIGQYAFSGNELTEIKYATNNKVTYIGQYAFNQNKLSSVTIPDKITAIQEGAFRSNQLTSVTIPENVITIGTYAFSGNPLIEVIIKKKGVAIATDAIPDGFYDVYINNNQEAGTYKRTLTPAITTWIKSP